MKQLIISITLLALSSTVSYATDDLLIPFGSVWKYNDTGANLGTAWIIPVYNDASWSSGPAELGYGDGDEATVVGYGPDASNKYLTTYFRHTINIADVNVYQNFQLKIKRDDGAIVYVNGNEVMRSNFGTSSYQFDDDSYTTISSSGENIIFSKLLSASMFQNGENLIAVEIHQSSVTSSDLSFDLELTGLDDQVEIYREPYLQMVSENSAIIKWKSNIKTDSRVKFGTSEGNLTTIIDSTSLLLNHEVKITGLSPATTYYYEVGTSALALAGNQSDYHFKTNPVIGAQVPLRIWAIGDAGTGTYHQEDVRDAYINYAGQNKADIWLMLGDNAYLHGREADYHSALFKNMYEDILRNTPLWPTSGNHEFYGEADGNLQTGAHFDVFALPKNGEAGGIPSGTEAYYSFDYGNVHFVSLDSYDLDRDSTASMGTWLKNDLGNNNSDWTIVCFHYPPYTKATHDSDDPNDHSGRCIEMRENFNPIFERYGVDLVLGGHSHAYERSYLLDQHYDSSSTLQPSMILDNGDGKADGDGAYLKSYPVTGHEGTIYVVCGNSGKLSSLNGIHPAMYFTTVDYYGSLVIDIDGDTLESKFINEAGVVLDYFHIVKQGIYNSVQKLGDEANMILYPNPSTEYVNIKIPAGMTDEIKVLLYDETGKCIITQSKNTQNSNMRIDTSDLKNGTYTIKILTNRKLLYSRLMVIK